MVECGELYIQMNIILIFKIFLTIKNTNTPKLRD